MVIVRGCGSEDMYAQDSIDLLQRAGIDFKRHEESGIDVLHFGELLMSSGGWTLRSTPPDPPGR
jgi:hypothetical protein